MDRAIVSKLLFFNYMIWLQGKILHCERRKQVSAKYKIATFVQNYDKVWEETVKVQNQLFRVYVGKKKKETEKRPISRGLYENGSRKKVSMHIYHQKPYFFSPWSMYSSMHCLFAWDIDGPLELRDQQSSLRRVDCFS